MTDDRFYVYDLPDSHRIFYIGKGTGYRDHQHLYPSRWDLRKRLYRHIYNLYKSGQTPIPHRIMENLTEEQAFYWERFFILALGREGCNYNPGPLLNSTDGGDGLNSYSAQEIAQIREENKGRRIKAGVLADRRYAHGPQRARCFKGTERHGRKWRAIFCRHGLQIRTPPFESVEEAAHGYDQLALQYGGPEEWFNFPEEMKQ